MNTRSVRFRLTIWYALAFFFTAAVIFSTFFLITKNTLYAQTDSILKSHGEKIFEVITRESNSCPACRLENNLFLQEFSDIPGMVVIFMDGSGNIIGSSVPVENTDERLHRLFEESARKKTYSISNHAISGMEMRFWINPIFKNGQLFGVIFVGHPIDVITGSLNRLLLAIAAVFLLFIIPTIFVGHFFAKSAIRPLTAISGKLKKISSENLHDRVELPRTNDELTELAVTFNKLLDRISAAFRREKQFIGDVAHQLKTPLAIQRSSIEVVRSKARTKKDYIKALDEALFDNRNMSATLDDILDLAWTEADVLPHMDKLNLSDLAEEVMEMTVTMGKAKNIAVSGDIEKNISIHGKKEKLYHALMNIADNAVKYSSEKGEVVFNLYRKGNKAHLFIRDNGIGIGRNDLPFVFDRFFRGSGNNRTSGSGIGLPIAKAIIIVHKGKIKVISHEGKGTLFSIIFPLA